MIDYAENYTSEARDELLQKIKKSMSKKRFKHVLGVEESALILAKKYGCDETKASIAALTHDYAKERSADEFLKTIRELQLDSDLENWNNAIWHGVVGAELVRSELGIEDQEILQAIRVHTTGAAEMSLLDKIVYVADYIEPGRDFDGVEEARTIALRDLDEAVAYETKHTLAYLIHKNFKIYPKTIETYNKWVAKGNY